MGWLLGLPLKLLSLLGGILMVVLRFALPVLIGVGAAMLLRRYRRGKTDEEAVSWKKPEEPTFDGPVYTVDYQEVQPVSDTPDRPLPFGYKTIWMAAASQDPQQVIRALGGRDIRRANWQTGLQAAAEEANCVFVSPCLDGFVLVIGLPRFPEQGLAGAFRQVQAFATHRVTEYHAWVRVNIDGNWYNVDPTWDDQVTYISYDYFLVSDGHMDGHIWTAYPNWPVCPSDYPRP